MLPIFAKKQVATPVIQQDLSPKKDDGPKDDGLEACAMELILAIHTKDIKAVTQALRNAFELLESAPHAEGLHTYEAQNQKAGRE